jgi:hypothetical protein
MMMRIHYIYDTKLIAMQNTTKNNTTSPVERPVILLTAQEVKEPKVNGEYSAVTDTWSNRNYELASSKKHNENM